MFALQLERKIADEAASAKQALQDQAVRLKQEADDRNRDQYNELVDVKEQLQVRGLRPASVSWGPCIQAEAQGSYQATTWLMRDWELL